MTEMHFDCASGTDFVGPRPVPMMDVLVPVYDWVNSTASNEWRERVADLGDVPARLQRATKIFKMMFDLSAEIEVLEKERMAITLRRASDTAVSRIATGKVHAQIAGMSARAPIE